jgi:putative RNA 2'-phosphotransferase
MNNQQKSSAVGADAKRVVRLSKFLSLVLRHEPHAIGITLDREGWVGVDELLAKAAAKGTAMTRAELDHVVTTNEKKRFTFSSDGARIRAAQGHSVSVELGLTPKVPPALLFHGTAEKSLAAIMAEGLQPRARRHVHLSGDEATAVAVGKRHGKPVVLSVAAGTMHGDGTQFWQADNGVWLTDAVPPRYLTRVG